MPKISFLIKNNKYNILLVLFLLGDSSLDSSLAKSASLVDVDFSFVVSTNHIRGDVDNLVVDDNLLSVDHNSGVVDALSQFVLINQSLKSSLQESLDIQRKSEI